MSRTFTPGPAYRVFLTRLVQARHQRGHSLEQMGAIIGLSPAQLASFEAGHHPLNFVDVRNWLLALDMPFAKELDDALDATLETDGGISFPQDVPTDEAADGAPSEDAPAPPSQAPPSPAPPAGLSPAGLSPAGLSPAGLSPAGLSPAGLSPAGLSPAGLSPRCTLFVARLVTARQERGLTIEQVADAIHLDRRGALGFEAAKHRIPFPLVRTWCQLLDVPSADFLAAYHADMQELEEAAPFDVFVLAPVAPATRTFWQGFG